ncbi:DUF1289 domain-containing protein [Solimonas aquatica]|uniref:DUF1289 domain-containing protein n=1 Tax=Solimonas aquatica TaxID=489703 RepID=UPI000B8A276D|nr:DUF1289 domain-containing protein [Solimonas aquatica]
MNGEAHGQPQGTPSPCIGVCQLGPEQFCLGCGRSLEEIAGWLKASEQDKRVICAHAAQRLQGSA